MLTSPTSRDPQNSLGFFVDLAVGNSSTVRFFTEQFAPYRMKLVIYLPPGREENWVSDIIQVIRQVEGRNSWAVRFEEENLCQFISMSDMERISKRLPKLSVYVYGVAEKLAFDEDCYRRWHNSVVRTAYVKAHPDKKSKLA